VQMSGSGDLAKYLMPTIAIFTSFDTIKKIA
jgi:hypothetical protein